jgi:FKBP-type peptidyl-prolyl cis-trans isomerase FkpA
MKQYSIFLFLFIFIGSQSCTKNDETQDQVDQRLIQQYLTANNITNAQSTASGLHYIIEDQGTGAKPTENSKIEFFYVGKLMNGQIFDSSESLTIVLNQLIPGFREGIPLINESGKITLIIPSSLGYGSQGTSLIPANSILIFNVELLAILPD